MFLLASSTTFAQEGRIKYEEFDLDNGIHVVSRTVTGSEVEGRLAGQGACGPTRSIEIDEIANTSQTVFSVANQIHRSSGDIPVVKTREALGGRRVVLKIVTKQQCCRASRLQRERNGNDSEGGSNN